MSYDTLRKEMGQEPIIVAEVDLDFCNNTYGVSPCTAGREATGTAQAGGADTITLDAGDTGSDDAYNLMVIRVTGGTGSGQERTISDYVSSTKVATVSEDWDTNPDATSDYDIIDRANACRNTYITCKDKTNYDRGSKTYRFCEPRAGLPHDQSLYPCITGRPDKVAAKVEPGEGLGKRASVTVEFTDFTDSDIGVDPYVQHRTYDPLEQGTFFGRLLASNPYYNQRDMRLRVGFITNPWDWDNFQDLNYIIETFEGPFRRGSEVTYKVTGKDMLKKLDDKKSQLPEASPGTLAADITSGDGSLTLSPTGIGDTDYPASGTYRIGDEIGTYTRSGDTVTLTSRNEWGTTAEDHDEGDTFQDCLVYNGVNVVDVLDDLLNRAGIDESYIPYDAGLDTPTGTNDEWDDEKENWLNFNVTRVISEPTGVNEMIGEVCNECQLSIWFDEVNQKIKIRAHVPPLGNEPVTELDDSKIIKNTLKVEVDHDKRISRNITYYGKIDHTEDDKAANYRTLYFEADPDLESDDQYGEKSTNEIRSQWFSPANTTEVTQLSGRALNRFGNPPNVAKWSLDAGDADLMVGDLVDITTQFIQAPDGSNRTQRFQITRMQEKEQGHRFDYEALQFVFSKRNAFIGPNTLNDYNSESEINKQQYAFIGPNTGLFDDGGERYTII